MLKAIPGLYTRTILKKSPKKDAPIDQGRTSTVTRYFVSWSSATIPKASENGISKERVLEFIECPPRSDVTSRYSGELYL